MTSNLPKRLVVDTDVLFASFVKTDAHHKKVAALRKKLPDDTVIYLANCILAETVTLLARRVGKEAADRFLQSLEAGGLEMIVVDEKLLNLTKKYFLKQTSKEETFFDCVNMAAAQSYSADAIFSFDKGYKKNGFKLLE